MEKQLRKKYIPEACDFEDHDGMFTLHCSKKIKALKLFQELVDDSNLYNHESIVVNINDIKEERAYYCKDCGFTTIDEPTCIQCEKSLYRQKGKRTFVYYF